MKIADRAKAWLADDNDCYYSKSGCGITAQLIRDLMAENECLREALGRINKGDWDTTTDIMNIAHEALKED